MPTSIDVALVLAMVAWAVWDHRHEFPQLRRALAAGTPGARMRFYRRTGLGEWLLTAIVLAAWFGQHRAAAALGLALPTGWRAVAGAGAVLLLVALTLVQARSILALAPERLAKVRARYSGGGVGDVLPRDRHEWHGFALLSITAGVCEELIARGYLIWFFAAWLGPIGGLLVSSLLFGLGHAYQGATGVLKTGVVGLVMGLVYLGTRSLLPGMIVHTLIDVGSGFVGYVLFRDREQTVTAAAEAARDAGGVPASQI